MKSKGTNVYRLPWWIQGPSRSIRYCQCPRFHLHCSVTRKDIAKTGLLMLSLSKIWFDAMTNEMQAEIRSLDVS
ncbi:hypothetical protein DKX38_018775 [Salix brachista]|uniref:Uncharacterized protein n=1 Tax=Salix brachista TaxID=2182728 RepID=A0A5N5KNY2_9ROSI|nr:hypothetical protein DKX38_018775 [Salix brachista]